MISLILSYFGIYLYFFFPFFIIDNEEDAFYKNLFISSIKMERVKWVSKHEGQFYVSKSYPSIALWTSFTLSF